MFRSLGFLVGFRSLWFLVGFRSLWFRSLGFRSLGFRNLGFRVQQRSQRAHNDEGSRTEPLHLAQSKEGLKAFLSGIPQNPKP